MINFHEVLNLADRWLEMGNAQQYFKLVHSAGLLSDREYTKLRKVK